jgi:hypothetical protein
MQVNTNFGDSFTFNPTHPSKMYYVVREQTFEHWPHQMKQKSRDLAQNGFFYTGRGDRVTCFYCYVTLKQWDVSDRIEIEHSKWGPNCLFVKMISNTIPNFDIFRCC